MRSRSAPPAHAGHGWILAAAPSNARRFRVADPDVADTLRYAGAEIVDAGAEVELVPAREVRGGALAAAVDLGRSPNDAAHRIVRIADRVTRGAAVSARAPAASRALRSAGYRTEVVRWDLGGPLRVPGLEPGPLALVQHVPRRALVVGRRGEGPTLLEAALEDARAQVPGIAARRPLVREGLLVVAGGEAILRLAIGPATSELDAQRTTLEALRDVRPPALLADRIPWPLARGSTGLASWTAERAVPGSEPRALAPALRDDCVEFLAALHEAGRRDEPWSSRPDAETVAHFVPDTGTAVRDLAERVDLTAAMLPCGFAHGDFWSGNVLVDERGRLAGVIDWDAASPSRPPFLDLLHLLLVDARRPSATTWGRALVEHLVPWCARGGDETSRRYAARVGVPQSPELLRDLAAGYWLNRAAFQLASWSDRARRPAWVDANVHAPLRALAVP